MSAADLVSAEPLGRLDGGELVRRVVLRNGVLAVPVLTLGATLGTIGFRGMPMTLGFDTLAPYLQGRAYIGAVAGRYANRIAGGSFRLDGVEHQLGLNEAGITHLHGGVRGFSHRNWTIEAADDTSVTLSLTSPDGEEGYPGSLSVSCTYALAGDTLSTVLEARGDRATIVNLALHSYFNLGGAPDIDAHRLTVPADFYLPVDVRDIPDGPPAKVDGTMFDFRSARAIGPDRIDHNLVLRLDKVAGLALAARLTSPAASLEVWSTEPGLQVYFGMKLDPTRDGFAPRAGLCLEPQLFPDSPNRPDFPSPRLDPGATYRQHTEYRFSSGVDA